MSSNIVFNSYFLLIATATGADLRENIRAEQADREHDQDERHDEVHQLSDHVTNLEVRRADLDGQGRDTLARRRSRGEERHEDTVIQRLEESRHDTSEIKRRRQNDDVLRIEHLLIQLECFSEEPIMDVSYWGPPGWQLFHLIAASPGAEKTLSLMHRVLPCKFCRESTTKFVTEHPLKGDTQRWLYEIHRKVNEKLKVQAETDPAVILPDPDPTYEDVREKYANLLRSKPSGIPGRDFLFSIAFNYPDKPDEDQTSTQKEFLKSMKSTFPFPELRKTYVKYADSHPPALGSRSDYMHWMYGLLKRLAAKTHSHLRTYRGYAHHVAYYKSGCSKATYHGKTCRRVNGGYTKQRDHKRTRRIVAGSLLS